MRSGRCHCGSIHYELSGEPHWCSLCHCIDLSRHAGAPVLADVQIATLDDPASLAPMIQVQAAERIAWMERAHALPAFDRYPSKG